MSGHTMRDHRYRTGLAGVVGMLGLCAATLVFAAPGAAPGSLLVNTAWLAANAGSLRLVDYGRSQADYAQGHVPGAVYLDRSVVFDTVNGIEGDLPPADRVVPALEAAGISTGQTVVIYDANNGLWAARLFWALEYLGHPDVRLLDGGLARWKTDGRPVETSAPDVARGAFQLVLHPERIATKEWLSTNLANPSVFVLDARSPAEYVGSDIRAARGGHIPGSTNLDWQLNLAEGSNGLFLPNQELQEMYDSAGVSEAVQTVTLCQTGVRAAHSYFALRNLGYENVRMYDGSWVEWGNDPDTPIAVGDSEG